MERYYEMMEEAGMMMGHLAKRMKRDSIYMLPTEDFAIQDFLAESLSDRKIGDDAVSNLEYAALVTKCLGEAVEHMNKGIRMGLSLNERRMTDMLVGSAPHEYRSDIVKMAKAICKYVYRTMNSVDLAKLNEEQRSELRIKIANHIKEMAESQRIWLTYKDGQAMLGLMYIVEWLPSIMAEFEEIQRQKALNNE